MEIYKCEYCDNTFKSLRTINYHQKNAKFCLLKQKKQLKCEYCNYVSFSDKDFENHKNNCVNFLKSLGIQVIIDLDDYWLPTVEHPIHHLIVQNKIHEVRAVTDLPILVRPHPGKHIDLSQLAQFNVMLSPSKQRSLYDDLSDAHAACVFNSSSGVAPILAGVPLVVDDRSSVCWAVSQHDIARIRDPEFFAREQWIQDLAACHWSDEESRRGMVYQKFIPYIQ